MKNNFKALTLTLLLFFVFFLLLAFPKESLYFSFTGLQLWFNKMIPVLLPFMILSGIMIRMNLTENFVRVLKPLLNPILHISPNGIYAVIVGFLCGFPMGARTVADLYERGKLSNREASLLLAFCNNIGPVYFISFVLPTLGLSKKAPYLFGMYALPFLYGIFLRYMVYGREHTPAHGLRVLSAAENGHRLPLLDALDDSIMSGLYSISKLGGYMILFNLFNLIPYSFSYGRPLPDKDYGAVVNCLLEITSGISRMGKTAPLTVLLLLPFGGFSCIAQTYSMIKDTDLSLGSYLIHKAVLTGITILYYGIWYVLSPSTFLL